MIDTPKAVRVDPSLNIQEFEVDPSWETDLLKDAAYVEYRRRWADATRNYTLYPAPLFVEIETSYACNYKCPFCPQVTLTSVPTGGLMKPDVLEPILEDIEKNQIPSVNLAHGGEPLIRKDIPQILARLREVGVLDRMIHTNAYLLSEERSEAMLDAGITKINFSLDAITEETYDKIRIGGKFDRVYNNVLKFLELKKKRKQSFPRTRVSFVVTETNKQERQAFVDYWKDKVNVIAFQQEYDFSGKQTATIERDAKEKVAPCALLWQQLCVTHEGDVTCMHDYSHTNILGNVKQTSVTECWNSAEMNQFRTMHQRGKWCDIQMCQKCILRVKPVGTEG